MTTPWSSHCQNNNSLPPNTVVLKLRAPNIIFLVYSDNIWRFVAFSLLGTTGQTPPPFLMQDCYKDTMLASSVLRFELIDISQEMANTESKQRPETCIEPCLAKGFRYAGIRNTVQCWCGSAINDDVAISQCGYCPGNRRYRCGGNSTIAVYHTPPGQLSRSTWCYSH